MAIPAFRRWRRPGTSRTPADSVETEARPRTASHAQHRPLRECCRADVERRRAQRARDPRCPSNLAPGMPLEGCDGLRDSRQLLPLDGGDRSLLWQRRRRGTTPAGRWAYDNSRTTTTRSCPIPLTVGQVMYRSARRPVAGAALALTMVMGGLGSVAANSATAAVTSGVLSGRVTQLDG